MPDRRESAPGLKTGSGRLPLQQPTSRAGKLAAMSALDASRPRPVSSEEWPTSLWAEIWRERPDAPTFWLTRFAILRLLGLVYTMAFLTFALQGPGLLFEDGLTPAATMLERLELHHGSRLSGFVERPTIFWLGASDGFMAAVGWIGVVLSMVVTLGLANGIVMLILWALYMSIAHVGQTWYGFGWEMQLLENGFLAVFLVPLLDPRPFPRRPPPVIVIWLHRWLIVRIMLGAGLIKIRGDECWRDLTCLQYHYETQPIPNPLTPTIHAFPAWVHQAGVLFNHFVELVVPFFAFGPRRVRHVAGVFLLLLQVFIIVSGNLSFLNYLTIVPILACFDDGVFRRLLPWALCERAERARAGATTTKAQRVAVGALLVLVAALSIQPVGNLLSNRQLMNTSFDRLHLVNTYGAFGSVGKERLELVVQGTRDEVVGPDTRWRTYEFKCKPTDVARRPCVMSPYHYRLDWLIWFAAMGVPRDYPWAVHLVWKLLHDEPAVLDLIEGSPFSEGPPAVIKVDAYRYQLTPPGSAVYYTRTYLGPWLPPLSRGDPRLLEFLADHGWVDRDRALAARRR